jgi:glycosyltransferase involved in cell wall biosynthesis
VTRPLVSVLLPVFNGERFLERAVRSILAQTLRDFELLIYDDGSRDGSRAIAERVAAEDGRVRVISAANRGIVAVLNAGLDAATGTLIARMDADDVARPTRFERQVAYLEAHPEVVAVGTHALLIDQDDDPICPWFVLLESHEEIDRRLLGGDGGGTIVHPTVMMRREPLAAVGGYRADYQWAEDLDLFLRLAERGRLANLPDMLLDYRQHLSSVGVSRREVQRDAARRCLEDAWARRGLPGSPPPVGLAPPTGAVEYMRSWAWMALRAGNVRTARKYAVRTVRAAPLQLSSWQALATALRGR